MCNYVDLSGEQYTDTGESTLDKDVTSAETTASDKVRTSEDGSTLKTYSDTAVPGDIQTSTQMDGFGSEGIAMTGNDHIMVQIGKSSPEFDSIRLRILGWLHIQDFIAALIPSQIKAIPSIDVIFDLNLVK